jgi:protein kinase A
MLGGSDIKKMATGLLHHHHGSSHHASPTSTSPASSIVSAETIRQEKQFVAQYSGELAVLPPDEIQQDPRNKELGGSSKGLSVRDFELVRTLGTGVYYDFHAWLRRRGSAMPSRGHLLMRILRI